MAGWTCKDNDKIAWDGTIKADKFKGDGSNLTNLPSVPAGTIAMFGGATAPTGWLLCDNSSLSTTTYADLFAVIGYTFGGEGANFNLPDMRGIFPRGAGTSAQLSNANGTAFAGTLGKYQNDKFQGHYHRLYTSTNTGNDGTASYNGVNGPYDGAIRTAVNDGINGAPRTGTETNPANLGLTFIIKY